MTASTPLRSASACHRLTASAPTSRTARAASTSSSVPGKVMTPTRAVTSDSRCTDQSSMTVFASSDSAILASVRVVDIVVDLEFEPLALPDI